MSCWMFFLFPVLVFFREEHETEATLNYITGDPDFDINEQGKRNPLISEPMILKVSSFLLFIRFQCVFYQ